MNKDKLPNLTAYYTNENGIGMIRTSADNYYEMERKIRELTNEVISKDQTIQLILQNKE